MLASVRILFNKCNNSSIGVWIYRLKTCNYGRIYQISVKTRMMIGIVWNRPDLIIYMSFRSSFSLLYTFTTNERVSMVIIVYGYTNQKFFKRQALFALYEIENDSCWWFIEALALQFITKRKVVLHNACLSLNEWLYWFQRASFNRLFKSSIKCAD